MTSRTSAAAKVLKRLGLGLGDVGIIWTSGVYVSEDLAGVWRFFTGRAALVSVHG